MNFILGLYNYYEKDKDDEVIEKEMFIQGVYGVIMIEINTLDFIEEIFKLLGNNMNIYKKMQGINFSFDHVSKLTIKCTTVNKPRRSYIKSPT